MSVNNENKTEKGKRGGQQSVFLFAAAVTDDVGRRDTNVMVCEDAT